jgi:hypothetical protein
MRNTVVAAVAAFVLGAVSTGVVVSWAQPAPPPGPPPGSPMGGPPPGADGRGPGMGRGAGPWADRMREHHARRMEMMRAFALLPRPEDRKLTPPDVQKIVEAFLLWNDNHTWKVINVKPDGDAIAFDLATPDGSVIASYTMDPKTGRPTRKS